MHTRGLHTKGNCINDKALLLMPAKNPSRPIFTENASRNTTHADRTVAKKASHEEAVLYARRISK